MVHTVSMNKEKLPYNRWIARLREDKIRETQKKLKQFGYMDEDDYNILAPPDGYNWRPAPNHSNGDFHGYSAWASNYAGMIANFPPVVVPYSSMAGNTYKVLHKFRKVRWNPDYGFSDYMDDIERYDIDHGIGQVHHFCGDVHIGLELGWGGLLEKIQKFGSRSNLDAETREFYAAEESLVRTIIGWVRCTSTEIMRKLEQEQDPEVKENLNGMLLANTAVEMNAPQTFREACQFVCWYNLAGRSYNREGAGGQLDHLLYPYYAADIKVGRIDDEDAVFYLAGVLLSDTKYYQLCGPGEDGKDLINRVSWLVLEAADRLNLTANITVRWHDGLDREFFKRAVQLLFKYKNAWPRFSGDKSLVSGFTSLGFSEELARKRIAVGCNWMAIPGVEYGLNDSIKVNLAKIFEVAFFEMVNENSPSTQLLWGKFIKHLSRALEVVFKTTDFHLQTNRYNSPELFLNLFCYGPIEKGRDASDHSLDYYNIAVDAAGIAVAADSFAAIEQRVEKEGLISWIQLVNALRCNFSSPVAKKHRALLQTAEKYGQFDSLGLRWAKRISHTFSDLVVAGQSAEGARFIPGLFSWSKTIAFGERVGATPDGRKAGEPINHGANPMPKSVKSGEMTTLSDAIAAVQCRRGNTAAFQMELDPSITESEGGVEKVMALLQTHFEQGGTLVNVNIVDADTIRKAHANPDLYPDLVVRVTGFTAYFSNLSPGFRQLVVDRLVEAK